MGNLKINAFYTKGKPIEYNYELEPLIEEFNKEGFYTIINSISNNSKENGAYLAITGKQYILTLNYKYGSGTHLLASARLYSEITNQELTADTVVRRAAIIEDIPSLFYARIYYEYLHDNEYGRPIYSGSIAFPLRDKKFNTSEIEIFLKFYEDYNKEIESICKNYNFKVFVSYTGKDDRPVTKETNNLDYLKNYILENRDDTITDYFEDNNIEEKIIGTTKKEDDFTR